MEAVADVFGVSSGAVMKSTRRVLKGLNRLDPTHIVWPDSEKRQALSEWSGERCGFIGCIGATDGTTFLLAYQAALHPWAYYDRNCRYSLNAVITCDWNDSIISVVQGCTGAAPDSFVQSLASWHKHPGAFFSDGEYPLGDKGMKYTSCVLGRFLEPDCTSADRRTYNFQLARLRVRSEHTIGILKGR